MRIRYQYGVVMIHQSNIKSHFENQLRIIIGVVNYFDLNRQERKLI